MPENPEHIENANQQNDTQDQTPASDEAQKRLEESILRSRKAASRMEEEHEESEVAAERLLENSEYEYSSEQLIQIDQIYNRESLGEIFDARKENFRLSLDESTAILLENSDLFNEYNLKFIREKVLNGPQDIQNLNYDYLNENFDIQEYISFFVNYISERKRDLETANTELQGNVAQDSVDSARSDENRQLAERSEDMRSFTEVISKLDLNGFWNQAERIISERNYQGEMSENALITVNSAYEGLVIREVERDDFEALKLLEAYRIGNAELIENYENLLRSVYLDNSLNKNDQRTMELVESLVLNKRRFYLERASRINRNDRGIGAAILIETIHREDPELLEKAFSDDPKEVREFREALQEKNYYQEYLRNQEQLSNQADRLNGDLDQIRHAEEEAARNALGLRNVTPEWRKLTDNIKNSGGGLRLVTNRNGEVFLETRDESSEQVIRFRVKSEQEDIRFNIDSEVAFRADAQGNPFPDTPFKEHGVSDLEEMKKEAEVLEFQVLLAHLNAFDNLSADVKDQVRKIFVNVENCFQIVALLKEYSENKNISWQDGVGKIMNPYLMAKNSEKEGFFETENSSLDLDEDGNNDLIVGQWFKKSGDEIQVDSDILKQDLSRIAEYYDKPNEN